MRVLADSIRTRTTEDLQNAIQKNLLSEEATPIAKEVLEERGAEVPETYSNEALEEEHNAAIKASNIKGLIILAILSSAAYSYIAIDDSHPNEEQRWYRYIFITLVTLLLIWINKHRRQ